MRSVCGLFFIALIFASGCAAPRKVAAPTLPEKRLDSVVRVLTAEPRVIDSVIKPADTVARIAPKEYTPNFGLRKPSFVIIHHTAQDSCEQTLRTFADSARQVSAHYLVCKDGFVHHLLNDYLRAWHAGASKWGNATDINSLSVGIELDNNGRDSFPPAQLNALLTILGALKDSFALPAANFIGHADVAPGRKTDPSVLFPWKMLAEKGFGNWWGDTTKLNVPPGFNSTYALRIVGYDISNLPAATQAFRRHFIGIEAAGELLPAERKVLYALMLRYL